jgi:formylglycine-generating enzyme required for sulfatase activity
MVEAPGGAPSTLPASLSLDLQALPAPCQGWLRTMLRRSVMFRFFGATGGPTTLKLADTFVPLTVTVDAVRTGVAQGHPNAIPQLQLDEAIRRAESRPGGAGTVGLVILGEPGSGKSTLLRNLFGRVATTGSSALGFPRDLIPVIVRCDEIPHECSRGGGGGLAAVVEHVATMLNHRGAGEASIAFEPRRPFLFLLDALDEVRDPDQRAQLCAWLSDQLSHDRWHDSRFVITCRQAAWRRAHALDNRFLQVTVQGLSDESIRTYVENYFVALDEVFSLDASEQRRTAARERAHALLEQVAGPGRMSTDPLRRITPNPLLLAQLCLVCREDPSSVPRNRNELHDRCLGALVNTTPSERAGPTLPATIIATLQPLAWEMQVLGAEHVWSLDQIVEVLTHVPLQRNGVEIAPQAIVERLLACGVLDGDERDHRFAHLSFQEYLAARFACEGAGGLRAGHEPLVYALAVMADDARWDQVILMAVGGGLLAPLVVALAELGTIERHKDLLAECVPMAVPLDEDAFQAVFDRLSLGELGGPRTADLLWSALGTHRPKALEAPPSDLVPPTAVPVAAPTLSDASVRPMRASPVSAQNGPRVVRGRSFATPVIATALLWVDGGEFWMGSSAEQGHPAFDLEAAADERDARRVAVSPFWIAEFPVTNRDYARYLDAQSSSTPPMEPAFWRDSRFNADEQPVVGVSFDAARSFCDWLSAAFPFADGVFRLPTEAEWEFAARGAELGPERMVARYPWGHAMPTTAEADFGQDLGTGKPAPVGTHPLGRSKSSHAQDLAGGVWEWCLDRWREGYDTMAGLRDPCQGGQPESSRVIRGGSWDSGSWRLRSSYRHGLRPTSCHSNIGFRVVAGGQRLHLAR